VKKNQIKAIAIDLDGTLLNSRQKISSYTRQVLDECRKRDIKLIIATGRNQHSAAELVRGIGPVSFISNNGSQIVDEEGKVLREREISRTTTREIINFSREIGKLYFFLISPDALLMPPPRNSLCKPLLRHLFSWKGLMEYLDNRNLVPRIRTKDVEGYLENNPFKIQKINFIGEAFRIEALEKRIEILNLAITRGHEWSIDINPTGVTKGEALSFLTEQWGISQENLLAFGDGHNDLDMLCFAGTGVVMDNSVLGILKENADLVAPSNNEDGVARIIEKLVFAEA